MRGRSIIALVGALLLVSEGWSEPNRRYDLPRVVRLDTQRKGVANPVHRDKMRMKRAGTLAISLDNRETLYFANVSLGTPPQTLKLHIDTGSSDLWVNTPKSKLCSGSGSPCTAAGTYVANSSSTYAYVGSWFAISYVDGSGASGDYVTDKFTIGDQSLSDLQFGIGYKSTLTESVLGVGYMINEAQVGRAKKAAYHNFPAQLTTEGLINTNAYSLFLDDLDSSTGSILFGGVDTEHFTGNLQTLPLQAEADTYAEFFITLTSVALGGSILASDMGLGVLLDSGSSLTYLPDTLTHAIYAQIGAEYDDSQGVGYVPCSLANNSTTLTFTFSSPAIMIAMSELVLDLASSSGKRPTFQNGDDACLFGIAPAGQTTNVLGDTFLRSAYVVFDLANNQISLAQSRFHSGSVNILEITAGTNGVPNATFVANSAAATTGLSGSKYNMGNSSAATLLPGPVLAALASLVIGIVCFAM